MTLSTQPYKGARDFYPEDERLQKYVFDSWRKVAERYGYEEYDAPLLEPTELYLKKGNEEIIKEQTFTFTDRGQRSVTLRTEMTPSVSRMVAAKRQELGYPLRWYSIPQCWRYERMQRGRGREFYQLNIDLFGLPGLEAEHEVILMADAIMQSFNAKHEMYQIKLGSRKLIDTLLIGILGLDSTQHQSVVRLIDRMHKMEYAEFVGQVDVIFNPTQRDSGESDMLLEFLKAGSLDELPSGLKQNPAVVELQKLMQMLENSGVTNAVFDPTLVRGFDYYTDIVFEVFDVSPENNRSMFGGGRYEGLVEMFGAEAVPTVGFGMGDLTLLNFLETHQLLPTITSPTDIYAIVIGDVYDAAQKTVQELRDMGVNVAVDGTSRKLEKQIRTAEKKNINYVLFIGQKELDSEQFVLRDLHVGEEEHHGVQRIVSIVKDSRKK